MKQLFKTLTGLTTALLLGITSFSTYAAFNPVPMPLDGQTFQINNTTEYVFTPASNGVLSITTSVNPTFLWTDWSETADAPIDSSGVNSSGMTGDQPPFTYTFNVIKGKRYFTYVFFGSGEATANFEAGTDDTDYSDFDDMTMDEVLSAPLKLKFTAPTDGTLTVLQTGSFDSALFYQMPTSADDFSAMVQPNYGYKGNEMEGYTFEYSLVEDQTVYYISPNVISGSGIVSAKFTWEGVNLDEIPIAKLNEKFNPYNQVYQFTPAETGIMTVYYSAYNYSLLGQGSSPVYTDAAHANSVPMLSGDEYGTGYEATYQVEGGKTYYFYNDIVSNIEFTITGLIKKDPVVILKLTQLLPQPGDASWNENINNYGSGFQYLFSPVNVEIASATVRYVDYNDASQTVTFSPANADQMEFQGDGWIVRLYSTLEAIKANGKGNTYFTVTLNNVTLNGQKMNIEYDEVTEAAQYVSVDNQTGSVSFNYFIAGQEMALVPEQTVWPSMIYQNWTEGDANGKAILVFTNPVKELNEATITLGNQTWGSIAGGDDTDPTGDIPYTIENNILTLDFTKVEFDKAPAKTYNTCTIFITGITDIYGQGMGVPSIDEKIPFSEGQAENPVIAMESGTILKPEGNNYALSMDAFVIQWAAQELTPVEGANMQATLFINNVQQGKVPVTITQGEYTEVDDCISIDLTNYKDNFGSYLVQIPQGIVQNAEGHINPIQAVSCYILETNDDYVITPTPGEIEILNEDIKVTFTGSALAINQDAGAILWANNRIPASVVYDSLVIGMSDINAGTYNLVIPPTYLIIDNQSLNDTITAEFVVLTSGVEGLISPDEAGVYNIYKMNGVKVATGDESVVNSLAKGLYIINGKKVIVK